ncbi:MAG: hypothetical protein KGJ09_09735 [Candidatus Omnitrophica bacterium]|nr:hypothetical protein [Candidatus Omnitrophota bacterium]
MSKVLSLAKIIFFLTAALCATAVLFAQDIPQMTPVKRVTGNKVPGMILSDPQVITSAQKAVVILAACEGSVKWEVKSASGKDPASAVLPDGKNLIVFISGPDIITIRAYSTQAGQPTDTATTTITVASTDRAPPVKVSKRHATFILPKIQTPAIKALTMDDFKNRLKAAGIEWHVREGGIVEPELAQAMAVLGGIPAMIVSDADGNFIMEQSRGKLAGVDDALKALGVK